MKRIWLGAGIVAFSILLNSGDTTPFSNLVQPSLNSSANVIQTVQSKTNETVKEIKTVETKINKTLASETKTVNTTNLSNNNYYTNVDGNTVHSPAYSEDGSIPSGASARCKDGTYSFSQNRRGTCSGHGGVSTWY